MHQKPRVWAREDNIEGGEGRLEVGSVDKKESEGTEEGCYNVGREITIGSATMEGCGSEGMTGNGTEASSLAMFTYFPFKR